MTQSPATASVGTGLWRSVRLDVMARIEALPSLSSVVVEFLNLIDRDYFTARDFETVIGKDQALMARLLRYANSSYIVGNRTVSTIAEAVVLLGLEEMKRIVFSVSAAGFMRRSLKNYDYFKPHGFWVHALGVGLTARCIADAATRSPMRGDEAFVAGLLHDVGKLVIDDFLDEEGGSRAVTREDEVAAVGLDHAELGELILRQWSLPEKLVDAIKGHHAMTADDVSALVAPVRLAEVLCRSWRVGHDQPVDLSDDVYLADHATLLEVLGIAENRTPQIIWDVRQNLVGLEDEFTAED